MQEIMRLRGSVVQLSFVVRVSNKEFDLQLPAVTNCSWAKIPPLSGGRAPLRGDVKAFSPWSLS